MIAIPWYFAANELMTEFGIAYGISTIISFFWVPFSGSIVDRYSRKKVFLWICAISGSFTLLVSSMGFYQGQLHWVWIALGQTIGFPA